MSWKTEKDCKGHVSAGVLGIQHLMRGLTEYGGLELAYKIVTNDTYPSWGYMIKKVQPPFGNYGMVTRQIRR